MEAILAKGDFCRIDREERPTRLLQVNYLLRLRLRLEL